MSTFAVHRWERPAHYAGATHFGYFSAGVGQSRDSDAMERSNFRSMLARLGGESECVEVIRESHWAVGWVEWIRIKGFCVVRKAAAACRELNDYPILDESDFSDAEQEDLAALWDMMDRRERLEKLSQDRVKSIRKHARDPYGFNALNCPSDLL